MAKKIESKPNLLDEIVVGIENVKGQDIQILDLREIENTPCDFFVVCSGVHVFQKQIREYYNIEELWGDAKTTQIVSNY